MRFNLYLEEEEISHIYNIINKNNIIEYLIKNNLDRGIYNTYLKNINIKYNKLIREDIREEIDNRFFLYYNIYILY